MKVRYQAIAPLLAGEGSRAFLGLEISDAHKARPVVLVWVPDASAADESLKARLLRETQRAAQLQHPNIIRVHGLAAMEDGLARVVEFADGESLRKVLELTKTLPPPLAAYVAAEAAAGIHFAHLTRDADDEPWIHGDLRPETVMISFNGACKVTGYGALQVAPTELYGKRVIGRRTHVTPEQILGGRQVATVESDVYLLGGLLHECLTGQVPFAGEKDFDEAVVKQPLPHGNYRSIPIALIDVITKATAKRAQDRYSTALAFREAVEQAMGVLPTAADMAAFLREPFPEDQPARIARRQAIEVAMADFAQRLQQLGVGDIPPSQTLEAMGASGLKPIPRQHLPARPAPPPPPSAAPEPEPEPTTQNEGSPRSRSWLVPAAIAASVAFGVSGIAFGVFKDQLMPPLPHDSLADLESARTEVKDPPHQRPATLEGDAHPAGAVAATRPAPGVASGPKSPGAVAPGVPAPPAAGTVSASSLVPSSPVTDVPGEVTIKVDPPVDIFIDGERLGHTPLTAPVANGKHTFRLANPDLGISAVRTLTVLGKTKQDWSIGKGIVMVSAPDGASVFIDGRKIGVAPVKEIPAYEGQHKMMVTLGKAKYSQPFALRATETMYLTVELAPQE